MLFDRLTAASVRAAIRKAAVAAILVLVIPIFAPSPSLAQVPLLNTLAITSGSGTDALTVDFGGAAPSYQIIKRDDRSFEIQFPGARVAPKDRAPAHGSLIRLAATETALGAVLTITADVALTLQTSRNGNRFTFLFQKITPAAALSAPARSPTMPSESDSAEMVFLKYADVGEVLGMLGVDTQQAPDNFQNGFNTAQGLPAMSPLGNSPNISAQLNAPSIAQMPAGPSGAQRVTDHIAVDRRLNAVLLTGTPANIAAIKGRIALFDLPVASITLEAKIVELTENAARNVGLAFSSGGAIGTAGVQAQSFQKPTFALTLQAQILAQIEKGGGRVIAAPSIQALSGQIASILTGDAIPVVTNITYPGSPPTIQQQLQYINVGVQLQIQPRYSSDGYVTSRIMSQVSSVTAFLSGNIPQISQRQAVTQATVKDGESYVIGGLVQENDIRLLSKIPILGDLPLVGGLFRGETSSHQKTSLYIVVTPHVRASGQ